LLPQKGTHVFRNLLGLSRCQPVETLAELGEVDPHEALLIVLGDTAVLGTADFRQATGGLADFRRRGGAVLIATDRKDGNRLTGLKVGVPGWVLVQAKDVAYRSRPDFPLVTSFREREHPLLAGLRDGIATNLPSYLDLSFRGNDLEILASLTAVRPALGAAVLWLDDLDPPFLAAGEGGGDGQGRVVVLASPRVFWNDLMFQPDNDNFLFAANCVRWLTEGGRRRRVLFLDDGRVQTRFDVPMQKGALLPGIPVEVLNNVLHGLEKENRFNQLLLEVAGAPAYFRWLLLWLTALLLLWGLRRLFLARHFLEVRLPLVARKAALALAAPGVAVQRREGLLRGGNLWEAARDLARECFEAHAVPGAGSPRPPAFVVRGGWGQRRRLARLLRRLWDVAYGPVPRPVAPPELARLRDDAGRMRTALGEGLLTFQPAARHLYD
jgi:hypothetical protein